MTTQATETPTIVRFMQTYRSGSGPGYWPGEIAGFPPALAQDLIERGIAEATDGPPKHPALPTPPQPKAPDRPDRDKVVHAPPVKK